jgi:hypothetical protein
MGVIMDLYNTDSKDAHLCTVGKDGPSCYIVQNAVKVLVANEFGISLADVLKALQYAEEFPHKPSDNDL